MWSTLLLVYRVVETLGGTGRSIDVYGLRKQSVMRFVIVCVVSSIVPTYTRSFPPWLSDGGQPIGRQRRLRATTQWYDRPVVWTFIGRLAGTGVLPRPFQLRAENRPSAELEPFTRARTKSTRAASPALSQAEEGSRKPAAMGIPAGLKPCSGISCSVGPVVLGPLHEQRIGEIRRLCEPDRGRRPVLAPVLRATAREQCFWHAVDHVASGGRHRQVIVWGVGLCSESVLSRRLPVRQILAHGAAAVGAELMRASH